MLNAQKLYYYYDDIALAPDDVAGLTIWLDADDISTLFQDSGKTTPVTSDADPVGAWADKSGNGFDALQVTTTLKPVYKTNQANGKPVIRGDGTDDYLNITGLTADASWTIIIVTKAESPIGSSQRVWGFISTASLYMIVSTIEWNYFRNQALATVDLNEAYTTYKALALRFVSASSATYESNIGNKLTFDPDDAYSIQTGMGVFANAGGSNPGSANIAEFVVYDRALTDSELAGILQGFRNKWGLA